MHQPIAKPWRFVATEDVPEAGLRKGDIITATAGRPTRVTRVMPIDPGLLLNLSMEERIAEVEGVVGQDADIVAAMEAADSTAFPFSALRMRVVK